MTLLPAWQPFYYGLNSVDSGIFVNKPGELEIVPCKELIELFKRPRRLPFAKMVKFTLDSAYRHGVLENVDALDRVYFPGERVFAAIVDELQSVGNDQDSQPADLLQNQIRNIKRFYAFLTLPYLVARHLG